MSEQRLIGKLENYYGGIEVKEERGKYYWCIPDYNGEVCEAIPQYLFEALNKFQDEEDAKQ